MTKSILILGAGEGIGLAIVRKFHQEGFQIGLVARTPGKLAEEAQAIGAFLYPADTSDYQQVTEVVKRAQADLGGLDVLLYNAAAMNVSPVSSLTPEILTQDFRVNVGGAHAAVMAALPDLRARGGSVLFTGGGLALHPAAYAGSLALGKAALRSLAFSLNAELASQGVHVGTVTVMGQVGDDQKITAAGVAEQFWALYQHRKTETQYSG